jgi:ABC-type transport system substrate-binding protein
MNRRDRFAIVGLFLALAVVGAALLIRVPSSGSNGPGQGSATSVPYREGVVGHPSSINPLTPRSQADRDLVALLFRGLVKAGPNGTVVPDLATWTSSADGRAYTFQMREDAYWDDGQPVTAADVVYTVGLLQDPSYNGPVGSSWQGVRATSKGSYTVTLTMTLPIAGFLREAELPILPSHLLMGTPVAQLADSDYSSRPVGDGAYRIVELDYSHALLARVTAVTGAPPSTPTPSATASASPTPIKFATATPAPTPSPQPTVAATAAATAAKATPTPLLPPLASGTTLKAVSNIELIFYADSASAAADFSAGKLDAVGGLTPAQTDAALKIAGSRLVPYRWANLLSVVVNQRADHQELRDPNARTGLLAAIDRNALLTKVLEGRGSFADLPIPNWSSAYDSGSVTATPYDILDAEGYLATAGWQRTAAGWTAPKGTAIYSLELLTMDQASNPVIYQTAMQVAAAWAAIGLVVQVDAVPTAAYMQRLNAGQFSSAIVAFGVGLDPDLGPLLLSSQVGSGGSNVSGLQDATLDGLLLTVHKTVDPVARQEAISALEKYISTTLPILPLAFRDYDLVVSNGVRNMVSNPISDPSGRFWDVINWRLASGR